MSNQNQLVQGHPQAGVSFVTADSALAQPLGQRVLDRGNQYVYVYNTAGTEIGQGMLCYLPAGSLTSGSYSVTVSNAVSQAGDKLVVGVAQNATIPAGEYGYVVVRGIVSPALETGALTLTSGAKLACGLNGGFVTHLVSAHTGVEYFLPIGVALNSCPTTVGTGRAIFRSPFHA